MKKLIYLICILLLVSSVNAFSLTGFVTGLFEHDVAQAVSPKITNYYADPVKVMVGQELRIVVSFEDEYGIESGMVTFPYEGGYDSVTMKLIDGTDKKGTFVGTWTAHDTKNRKWYYSKVLLVNKMGKSSSIKVAWEDPTVSHPAAQITPGDFQTGDYHFPNGNVGVGTNGPAAKLEVESSSFNQMKLERTGGAGAGVSMEWENSDDETAKIELTGSQQFDIEVPSGTPVMSIQADGDVGIGTQTPGEKLEVSGNINSTGGDICITGGNCLSTAGGGPSGSGAANRAAFWTDASSLSYDDNFTWDNTNKRLGIGTTSPAGKLEIIGESGMSSDAPPALNVTGGTPTFDSGAYHGGDIILKGGQGAGQIMGNGGQGGTVYINPGIGGSNNYIWGAVTLANEGGAVGIGTDITSQTSYKLIVSGETALNNTLYTNGDKIGIGTTTPTNKLQVIGDANITGTVYAHNYSGNSDIVFINGSGSEIARMVENGNVGIGTTTPSAKLEMPNNETIKIGNTYISSGSEYGHIGTHAWWDGLTWHFDGTPGQIIQFPDQTQDFQFLTHNGSEFASKMTIQNSTGNVGIGTNSPDDKLTVSGGELQVTSSSNTGIQMTNTGGGGTWYLISDTNDDFKIYDTEDRFVVDTTGNIGIGTSSPDEQFTLGRLASTNLKTYTNADEAYLTYYYAQNFPATSNYDRVLDIVAQPSNAGSWIRFLTGTASSSPRAQMVISDGGNVGINDSNPTEGRLVVDGGGGIYAKDTSLNPTRGVVYGYNPSTTACANTIGVHGQVACGTGYAVYGRATGTSGRGVYGLASGSSGSGVYGQTSSSTGNAGYFTGGYGLRIAAGTTFLRSSVGTMFACTGTAGTGIGNDCDEVCGYHGLSCYWGLDVAGYGDRSEWKSGSTPCGATCSNGGQSGGIIACLCY